MQAHVDAYRWLCHCVRVCPSGGVCVLTTATAACHCKVCLQACSWRSNQVHTGTYVQHPPLTLHVHVCTRRGCRRRAPLMPTRLVQPSTCGETSPAAFLTWRPTSSPPPAPQRSRPPPCATSGGRWGTHTVCAGTRAPPLPPMPQSYAACWRQDACPRVCAGGRALALAGLCCAVLCVCMILCQSPCNYAQMLGWLTLLCVRQYAAFRCFSWVVRCFPQFKG